MKHKHYLSGIWNSCRYFGSPNWQQCSEWPGGCL